MAQEPQQETGEAWPAMDEALARRFWLGALTEAEEAGFYSDYFTRAECITPLEALRDELIDDYLDNRLTPAERLLFERNFLRDPVDKSRSNPHHVELLESARHLRAVLPEFAPAPWWRRASAAVAGWLTAAGGVPVFAALALAVTGVLGFIIYRQVTTPGLTPDIAVNATPTPGPVPTPTLVAMGTPIASPRSAATPFAPKSTPASQGSPVSPPATPKPPPAAGAQLVTCFLHFSFKSEGTAATVKLTPAARQVRLDFELLGSQPPQSFVAELWDETTKKKVWPAGAARLSPGPKAGQASAVVPASVLRGGSYTLRIRNQEPDSETFLLPFEVRQNGGDGYAK